MDRRLFLERLARLVGSTAAAFALLTQLQSADINAAVVFYGPAPALDKVAAIRAPLLLHFAGNDGFVNPTVPPFEAALKAAGKTYTLYMYEGAQHAFHNDTSAGRYNADAAKLAWTRTIEFYERTLR